MRCSILVLALALAPAVRAGLTDTLDVSLPGDEARHAVRTLGKSWVAAEGDRVGDHETRRLARWVTGDGSWAEWMLKSDAARPLTLEIEEMYGRDTGGTGYAVSVDGRTVGIRTFRGCGAGPVHHFVEVAAASGPKVRVRVTSLGGAPVRISRVWAWSALDDHLRNGGFDVPFRIAPTVALTWKDAAEDAKRVRAVRDSLPAGRGVLPAFTTWVGYAAVSEDEAKRRVDYAFEVARRSGMPVQLSLDTWWANTPSGDDGDGGRWTDQRYQQRVWDAVAGKMRWSVPNQWSNTPWLSMNESRLMAFKTTRLRAVVRHIAEVYSGMCAAGEAGLLLALNLDNEPVYWASGNAGLGPDLLQADFSPSVIDDAFDKGVTLDPRDGLAPAERRFLFDNLLRYQRTMAAVARHGLGRDAAVVTAKGVRWPTDHLRSNVFTQAMTADPTLQYPMLDPAWPLWETGAPVGGRVGGEWIGPPLCELEAAAHQLPLGRTASVNVECGDKADDVSRIGPAYPTGQRYVAPYNYPLDGLQTATGGLAPGARFSPPFEYRRTLLETSFLGDAWRKSVKADGIQTGLIGNTAAIAAYPARADVPGALTWTLSAPTGGWKGLALELEGRSNDYGAGSDAVRLRVLAGPNAGNLTEAAAFSRRPAITAMDRLELSRYASGSNPVTVRIEFRAPSLAPELLSWCAVWRVRFVVPWNAPKVTGSAPRTLQAERGRNLLVSWRADAALAVAELADHVRAQPTGILYSPSSPHATPKARLARARALAQKGEYAEACREASRGTAAALPATFYVEESGRLEPYPIRVSTPEPGRLVAERVQPGHFVLRLGDRNVCAAGIEVEGLRPGERYRQVIEPGVTRVALDPRGDLKVDARGVLSFSVSAAPLPGQPGPPNQDATPAR